MQLRWHTRVLALAACAGLIAFGRPAAAAPTAGRPAAAALAGCESHLRTLGRALAAYRRDHHALPPHLWDLYPKYVADKRVFHCPGDPSPGNPIFPQGSINPKLHTSYLYEMAIDKASYGDQLGWFRPGPNSTWRQCKTAQQVNYGDRVPVITCRHHGNAVVNLTLGGQIYSAPFGWESDPGTVAVVADRMAADLAAGNGRFRRNWNSTDAAYYFTQVGLMTQSRLLHYSLPAKTIRRLPQIARRIMSQAPGPPATQAGAACLAAGLYLSANDVLHAIGLLARAVAADPHNVHAAQMLSRLAYLYQRANQPDKAAEPAGGGHARPPGRAARRSE